MEWQDNALILSVRPFQETGVILELMSRLHGRHLGLVRGGVGRALRGVLQPGNGVMASWRARLADQLGSFQVELTEERASDFLHSPLLLAGLQSAACVLSGALPEREAHEPAYLGLTALLDAARVTRESDWAGLYVMWEMGLLSELGFGLDLSRCTVTGAMDDLTHVSPRTGRAVSRAAAAPYAEKLLRLPAFLLGRQAGEITPGDIRDGLMLTGHFLERHVLWPHEKPLPPVRARLAELAAAGPAPGAESR
ncbi:MAG: DNA repair protein RecO [Alphaproteobacteria bacterium]|nr:DNA repair protein RecO [Alphaproteobacteria bacterium]